MRQTIRRAYARWLARRMPAATKQQLRQRYIYILPTGYGFLFLTAALAIFIGGINYQNNLLLGLSFFLASQFVLVIFSTFRNLLGLTVQAQQMQPNYKGENGVLSFQLTARKNSPQVSLGLRWHNNKTMPLQYLSLQAGESGKVKLPLTLQRRGWNIPGRLWIETRYPMGLLRAWSFVDMAHHCLAWPVPLENNHLPFLGEDNQVDNQAESAVGEEEFHSLREYTETDSPSRVDWKVYAQGRGLYVKEFSAPMVGTQWLDWHALPSSNSEKKLSWLCYWVLQREQNKQPYGLRLPNKEITPSIGGEHKVAVLNALASYQEGGANE